MFRKFERLAIAVLGFVTAASSMVGCIESGTAQCKEECTKDEDCMDGLACIDTSTYGLACIPERCNACYDDGNSCYFDEEALDDFGAIVCTFDQCG